jgi:hypothetical protein
VDSGSGVSDGTNRLLDTLPAPQRHRLTAVFSHIWLEPKTVLFEPSQTIEVVDFPRTCVISLVTPFADGSTVEVASIGNEGIVGVPLAIGGTLAVQAICSIGGWVDRMPAGAFTREVESDLDLHHVVDDYLRALFNQVAQAVACNRLHSTTERLARWVLASSDRLGTDEFAITYHLLGRLLGSSETTVRGCSLTLHTAGLTNFRHGWMTIVDRPALEAVACECYAVIRDELDGVIQRAEIRFGDALPLVIRP